MEKGDEEGASPLDREGPRGSGFAIRCFELMGWLAGGAGAQSIPRDGLAAGGSRRNAESERASNRPFHGLRVVSSAAGAFHDETR